MSKRSHESATQGESREERWLRKLKLYEEKLSAKRSRLAENQQILPPVEGEVQIEEHPEYNEGILAGSQQPTHIEVVLPADTERTAPIDTEAAEFSEMTETTACTSPNCTTCYVIEENMDVSDYDPDLLRELGDEEADPAEFGDDLQADVAARFQRILQDGLNKEEKDGLIKKCSYPKNVPLAKSPTLNPEISVNLAEACKLRDKRLLSKQDQLGKALSALGNAFTNLLKKTPDIPDVIRTLNDAGKLLADSHYAETDTRRSVLIPLIDKSLADPFKDRKRDTFLFGEKLGDLVKDSQGIKKTGQFIHPAPSTSSNLNARGPLSRGNRQQRGGQSYHPRAGGPRNVPMGPPYQNRRRAAQYTAQQQPPARRHVAPPPGPPAPARRAPPPPYRPSTSRRA
ncbi:uncharacterized protein LOC125488546 [Plutella xylostella]|uniref:uncharacterized protein LOC125488546 n=1 Tax=Plutella xylostella TaxID=51655 RepID=UPI00203219FB|nr:uncharacterized protein LOC125488546 [Plutella xylostella]